MKRDMDLIRQILLDVEAGKWSYEVARIDENGSIDEDPALNLQLTTVLYHLQIMHDAGFIKFLEMSDTHLRLNGMTWAGHDFLDTIRDDENWRKTKEGAKKLGGAGFSFIVEVAKGVAKSELQKLGLPLP